MRRIRIPNEDNTVPHVNLLDLGTKFFHHPHSLAAHCCRKVRFIVTRTAVESLPHKVAAPLLNIKKINARSFDAHSNLSWPRNRHGQFFELHHLWTAVAVNANGVYQVRYAFLVASCRPVLLATDH